MKLLIVGGSDAGISAALRAREIDSAADITVLLAHSFPNYSICGLPFYLSGETPGWRSLAHRTEFPGIEILPVPGVHLLHSMADGFKIHRHITESGQAGCSALNCWGTGNRRCRNASILMPPRCFTK